MQTPSFEHGVVRALVEVVVSTILTVVLESLLGWKGLIILSIVNILAFINDLGRMKYWGSGYILGSLLIQSRFLSLEFSVVGLVNFIITEGMIVFGLFLLLKRILRAIVEALEDLVFI